MKLTGRQILWETIVQPTKMAVSYNIYYINQSATCLCNALVQRTWRLINSLQFRFMYTSLFAYRRLVITTKYERSRIVEFPHWFKSKRGANLCRAPKKSNGGGPPRLTNVGRTLYTMKGNRVPEVTYHISYNTGFGYCFIHVALE